MDDLRPEINSFGATHMSTPNIDPHAQNYGNLSPYTYVANNPLLFIDPDGRDIIINGSDGNSFNWKAGSSYDGDDAFIQQTVSALNSLTENSETDDFTFKGKKSTGIVFEGNAIEDFAAGGSKEDSNVSIEYGEKSVHSAGTVYWNPAQGMREEGMKGAEGGGAFPSMGLLLHEMGHAALYNEYGDEKQNLFANEEQMIIDHLENPGMQSMGFGYRTQHNVFPNRAEALINNQGSLGSYKATYYIPSIPPTIRIR